MDAGSVSIQLTIIEANARMARESLANACALAPHVNTPKVLRLAGGAVQDNRAALKQAFDHHNLVSRQHLQQVINQAMHLQATLNGQETAENLAPSTEHAAGDGGDE